MAMMTSSRYTARELMKAVAQARLIIKTQALGKTIQLNPNTEVILLEKLLDELEYIYRLFSMFAWLTLGGNSIDDRFVLEKLSKDLGIDKNKGG